MPVYNPKTWADGQGGNTPITAAELNRIEAGIAALDAMRTARLPTNALAETIPRITVRTSVALVSGRLQVASLILFAGDVINSITWLSGAVALAGGSNQWFALWNASRVRQGITADDGATAWAANTPKTLALTAPYTVPTSGLYYITCLVVATTVPTLHSNDSTGTIGGGMGGAGPILYGTSNTGLTDPASAPSTMNAIAAVANCPYGWVS